MKSLFFSKNTIRDPAIFESIFLLVYSTVVAMGILGSSQLSRITDWGKINTIVMALCFMTITLAYLFFGSIDRRGIILCIIMLLLCVVIRQESDRGKEIIFFTIFAFLGAYINQKRAFRCFIVVASSAVAFILILYYSGFFYVDYIGRSDELVNRMFLGFVYTTYLSNYIFHITLAYFFIKKKPINLLETIIFLGINLFAYLTTDTRAVFYELIVFIAIMWLIRVFPNIFKPKIFKYFSIILMPALAIIIFVLSYKFSSGSSFLSTINNYLSGRLALGQKALNLYGVHLFGAKTKWYTGTYGVDRFEEYFYVDSSYLNIMLSFGIIILIFICLGFSIIAKHKHEERQYMAMFALVFLAIHSFTDPQLFEIRYDPFILLLGSAFLTIGKTTQEGLNDMGYLNKNEREVSIKTLFYRVIRHWKLILIVSAIIGAGAAGLKMVTGFGNSESAVEAQEKYEKDLADYKNNQKTYKDTIKTMEDTLQSKLDYLSNSILIQLDPNAVSYAYDDYFITSDDFVQNGTSRDTDYTGSQILDAYSSYLNNEIDWEPLAKEMDTEPQYLMELAGVSKDYSTGRLTLSAKHNNPGDAKRVLDYIIEHADSYEDTAKDEFGDFSIKKRDPVETEIMDSSLQNLINNKATELKNLENSLNQLEQSYNKLEPPAVPSTLGKSAAIKNAITFGAKIFGISLAAMAVLIALIILISRRVLSADELNKTFNLKEIATFKPKEDTKENAAAKYDVISECVERYSEGAKKILLVGGAPKTQVNRLIKELSSRLKDVSVAYVENVDDTKDSIEMLKAADAVVFVEKVGKSGYRRIEDNFDRVVNWDKPIAGSIVY